MSKQGDTEIQEGTMPAQKGKRTQEMSRRELRTGKGGGVPSAGVIVFSSVSSQDAAACMKGALRRSKRNIPSMGEKSEKTKCVADEA